MTSHPACIGELEKDWPWQQRLPGLTLITTRFDPKAFDRGDFEGCEINAPRTVREAVAKRQSEYLAGRLCARAALHDATGIEATPATRPDRAPQWPENCVGSITHSNGVASAIAGQRKRYASLGLDLEAGISDERAQSLVHKILTHDERMRFSDPLKQYPGDFLTLAFSLKESLFKALYPLTETRFYFQQAELIDWQPEGTAKIRLLTTLSGDWALGTELDGLFAKTPTHCLSLIAIKAPPDSP